MDQDKGSGDKKKKKTTYQHEKEKKNTQTRIMERRKKANEINCESDSSIFFYSFDGDGKTTGKTVCHQEFELKMKGI